MTVRVYRSTDVGAVTTGSYGPSASSAAVLEQTLVTGYGTEIARGYGASSTSTGAAHSKYAQPFTPSATKDATTVLFELTSSGAALGTYRIGIATSLGGGTPVWVGGDAYVDVINPAVGYVAVTLPTPRTLTSGTQYYAVIMHQGGTNFGIALFSTLTISIGSPTNPVAGSSFGNTYSAYAAANFTVNSNNPDKVAAGWSKPFFSGSNIAVFRQAGDGMDLSVNANNNAAAYAYAAGYERATAAGSGFTSPYGGGTNPFPASTAKAIPQGSSWIVVADDRTVMYFTQVSGNWYGYYFGDFYSYVVGDAYNVAFRGRTNASLSSHASDMDKYVVESILGNGTGDGTWVARNYAGSGIGIRPSSVTDVIKAGIASTATVAADIPYALPTSGAIPYPNPVDGGIYIAPIEIVESTGGPILRGRFRGLWMLCHNPASVAHGQTINGALGTDYEGRVFEVVKATAGGAVFLVETSDTWDTN
jgi:hypothetical protein